MPAPDPLELTSFWPARILLTAVETGLLARLVVPQEAAAAARACSTEPAATRRLLDALVALGVLRRDGARYGVVPDLRDALGEGPASVLDLLRHRGRLWEAWSDLTAIVRRGQGAPGSGGPDEDPERRQRAFSRAMAVAGRGIAERTAEVLDLEGAKRLLDVGGAPGTYAGAFRRRWPRLEVAILDRPEAEGIVRETLEPAPGSPPCAFLAGDALQIEDAAVVGAAGEGRFDVVFLSNLIHSMSPDEVERLLGRCARWARPGGRVVVKDFLLDETRTRPAWAAVFAVNMLVATPEGNAYAWHEVEGWLRALRAEDGSPRIARLERIDLEDECNGLVIGHLRA